ncbi:MAG: hypothetical protein CMJ94_10510 [Planctomycetes bacterium]|nr:hypothetical protein [Planctomycetota bacterium]
MAAKRKKKAAKPAKGKANKPAKQKKEKEPKEIKPGPPVESVMILVTGLLLLTALVMMDYVKGKNYGEGMFFKDSYEATAE